MSTDQKTGGNATANGATTIAQAPTQKADAELIAAAELVNAKECAAKEEEHFSPLQSQLGDQKQVQRNKTPINSLTINYETGKRCKAVTEPASLTEQDAAKILKFRKPDKLSPVEIITALNHAIKKTNEELNESKETSFSFTACAVAHLTGDEKSTAVPVVTTVQIGESGAMLVEENKPDNYIPLTSRHSLCGIFSAEQKRTCSNALSKITNKTVEPLYLYDGFSLHINPTMPVIHHLYAGSFILFRKDPFINSKLFYVSASKEEIQEITIRDYSQLENKLIRIMHDPATLQLIRLRNEGGEISIADSDKKQTRWGYFARQTPSDPNKCSLRLTNFQFLSLIGGCCMIDPEILPTYYTNKEFTPLNINHDYDDCAIKYSARLAGTKISQTVIGPQHVLALYTDGVNSLKPSARAMAINKNELRKAAFLAGSKDDITTFIIRNTAKVPDDILLVVMVVTGHGIDPKAIIEKFKIYFKEAVDLINKKNNAKLNPQGEQVVNAQLLERGIATLGNVAAAKPAVQPSPTQQKQVNHHQTHRL